MFDGERSRQLRDDFWGSFERARESLISDESVSGLLELYDPGLITSLDVRGLVWKSFHNNEEARNRVCEQLRSHSDDSIRRIPDTYDEPGFTRRQED